MHLLLETHLREQTGIKIHQAKTKLWNAGGHKPSMADALTAAAPVANPKAEGYVTAQLTHRGEEQAVLFDRIPCVVEIQTGWLLLTFCAAIQANDWLRTGPPELTAQYARLHDQRVLQGLSHVLQIS